MKQILILLLLISVNVPFALRGKVANIFSIGFLSGLITAILINIQHGI